MLPNVRLVSLYDQVRHCEQMCMEGSIVECGVWKGGAIGLIALALKQSAEQKIRHLHLFDSFTDICAPDPLVDGQLAIDELGQDSKSRPNPPLQPVIGAYDSVGGHGTMIECKDLIETRIGYPSSHVHFHVGWFQDTVPAASCEIGPIALLRLDGDWYASTKVCLDHLYEHVVAGGFVIIDDYGTYEGCRKAVDEFIAQQSISAFMHRVDASCYYFQKPGC
jgi:O-methyltransferase